VSFFGGGTDYPIWYEKHKGAVLATSIDKYCYIHCRHFPPFFPYNYSLNYSKIENVTKISEIDHPAIRETIKFLRMKHGIAMQYDGDLPARAGLGTSSAFTVGLLNALYALNGKMVTKRQLAKNAIHIEQKMIKENVGSQDQITTAYGGLNKIEFSKQGFKVQPIILSAKKYQQLQNHLMLFFTGFSRKASDIAGEQIKKTPERAAELTAMYKMVDKAIKILEKTDITDFGRLLHESWMIKRTITNKITTPIIDKIYKKAMNAGAIGGKLIGAGGGGFILFFVEPKKQNRVKKELKNLLHVPFRFENTGSQIIYYSPNLHS